MEINEQYLGQVTVGIRFQKLFRISDIIGSLFDIVLHDPSTPFGTTFFPNFHEFGPHDRMLYSLENSRSLRINTSDIIFQYTFTTPETRQEELDWFKNHALNFIINELVKKNQITNIQRFGYMMTHICEPNNVGGKVMSLLTNGEQDTADQFTLRFGSKSATPLGKLKSGVSDYINSINTIKQISPTHYDFTLDYQYYFSPEIRTFEDWNIQEFFRFAENNLKEKFYPMINSLVGELVTH
jgi:hypothetical protein